MPYHLELGSEGHSFHGKAIVVNSQTGEHKSHHPIAMDDAKAQMRVLEEAASHEVAPPKRRVLSMKKPKAEEVVSNEVTPDAPKKRRILIKLGKKPEPPKAEEPKPKAEEPIPKAEDNWLEEHIYHYLTEEVKMMYSHHHKIRDDMLSPWYRHKVNRDFRPEGMLSGEVKVSKNIGIDFSPHQGFSIFARK
jgi:hypothetical protein